MVAPALKTGELVHASTDVIKAHGIGSELNQTWLALHRSESRFASPYYHPNFVRAVAAVRDDVEIAILKNRAGDIVGVLPFQRISAHQANPIGGRMNDFHGILAPSRLQVDIKSLLNQLQLKRFHFHALSTEEPEYEPYEFIRMPSYHVDLSNGIEDYITWLTKNSSTVKRLPQKIRALGRNEGDVVFEFESNNMQVLEELIALKRNKFQRTNTFDILSVQWAADLLREIGTYTSPDFRGVMSALWAGDKLIAAHFGMIANDVLHYWFPAYDSNYDKYSPGLQLMLATCRAAAKSGIKKIDMSYGESGFKDKFCNGSTEVSFGVVDQNPLTFAIARKRYFTRQQLKQIPLKRNVKYLLRKVFPGYGGWHFR